MPLMLGRSPGLPNKNLAMNEMDLLSTHDR